MRRWGIAIIGLGLLGCSSRALAQSMPPLAPAASTADAGAQRINRTGRNIPLGGPLTDNGFILGEISYILMADDQILVDAPALLALLQPRIEPAALEQLAAAIGERQQISAQELETLGFPLRYDPATLGLVLTLRADLRPRQAISIAGGFQPMLGAVQAPEDFSAYVTAFVNADYVHRGVDEGFATPSVLLDSAIRFRGFVLENEATIQDRFSREGTRLVYDDLARTARYTAGDLEPISRGFSGTFPMAGLSIVRTYADLEPQRNIQPRGQRTFTLVRPSTVETFINGRSVQQTRLDPGTYDIRDFPFAQGANDVRLVVRDDAGVENVISFSINFDRTLLAPGLTEFGLFVGVETPFTPSGRDYSDRPVASGFFRRGLSEELTAGANFQASEDGAVLGGEVVWASPLGTIGVDLAGSRISGLGTGYALNIGFERVLGSTNYGDRTIVATFQTTSRKFATPGALIADNPFAYEMGVTYSQSLGRSHYISTDAFYSIGRGNTPDQASLRATYGWRANQRLLFTAEAAYEDRRGETNYGVRLALTFRFGRSSSATAEVDTRRERGRLSVQTAQGRGVGSYNASATVERIEDTTALNASFTTTRNRMELGAAHLTSFSPDGDIIDQRSSVRAGASIAFAGGHIALSRPIYDSFAIVDPHRSLRSAPAYLEPRGDEYLARSGAFGGAVASELTAYSPQVLTYDVPTAPAGYDLGPGAIQVVPPYRSGYLIKVGSDYSVTYTGQLLQSDGSPVSLVAGLAFEEAPQSREGARPPVRMFTNRSGRFAVQGLRAGRWRIEMPSNGGTAVYFLDVPAEAQGLVRGGELRPERQQ